MKKRSDHDVVGDILRLRTELRKQYRMRQTVSGPVRQELPGRPPPRGENRKNIVRIIRAGRKKAATAKALGIAWAPRAKKPRRVVRLTEHKERDSSGREIIRFTGDPMACWGPFTYDGVKYIDPRGTRDPRRQTQIRRLHDAGAKDRQIAAQLNISVKTVERTLKGFRKRARTPGKR